MSLAIIGMDGMTWDIVNPNLAHLPTLARLKERHGHGTLVCDVLAHSAPAWTTCLTGLKPEQHGVYEFYRMIPGKAKAPPHQQRGKRLTRADIPVPFIWEELEAQGLKTVALTIYCTLPPTNYNCHYTQALPFTLSLTMKEVKEATERQTEKVLELLADGVDFLATVFIGPDKAHHVWKKDRETIQVYRWCDDALAKILPAVDDWMIVSDHGYPSLRVTGQYGSSVPSHDPRGIVLCSWTKEVPRRLSEVTPWIRTYYEGLGESKVAERLEALGYL